MRIGRLGWLLVGALVTGTGGVEAQPDLVDISLELSVEAESEPVVPITGSGEAIVAVTVTCEAGSVRPVPEPMVLRVRAATDQPAYTVVSVNRSVVALHFSAEECAQGASRQVDVGVTMQFTKDAPAAQVVGFTVFAEVEETEVSAEADWSQVPGFYDDFSASLNTTTAVVRPGATLRLEGVAENFGNGPVAVSARLAAPVASGEAVMPAPFAVPSRIAGALSNQQPFEVLFHAEPAAGIVNHLVQVRLVLSSAWVETPDEASENVTLTAVVRVQNAVGEAPALGIWGPIAVLIAAGWVVARPARRGG